MQSNLHTCRMEGLKDDDIDNEIRDSLTIFHANLGIQSTYIIL